MRENGGNILFKAMQIIMHILILFMTYVGIWLQ